MRTSISRAKHLNIYYTAFQYSSSGFVMYLLITLMYVLNLSVYKNHSMHEQSNYTWIMNPLTCNQYLHQIWTQSKWSFKEGSRRSIDSLCTQHIKPMKHFFYVSFSDSSIICQPSYFLKSPFQEFSMLLLNPSYQTLHWAKLSLSLSSLWLASINISST